MLTLDNEKFNKMREVLEVQSGVTRIVTYFGIAEALVNQMLLKNGFETNNAALSLTFDKKIDRLNELSIVDRDLLKSCLRKVYKLRTMLVDVNAYNERLNKSIVYNSLMELLGVTEIYSNDDIYNINRHFDIYRNALNTTLELMNTGENHG